MTNYSSHADREFGLDRYGHARPDAGRDFAFGSGGLETAGIDPRVALRRVAMVAWMSIALGFAMEMLILAIRSATLTPPHAADIVLSLAQGVTWSFFVCAGVGLGTTLAKTHTTLGGLIGLLCAPIAMGLAKGTQKVVASALGIGAKPAVLSLFTLGALRAVEYGLLGWLLAMLAARQETRTRTFLAAGALVGVVFGGSITGLSVLVAARQQIEMGMTEIVALAVNEVLFPIGCALVVCVALNVGRYIKLAADQPSSRR